MTPPLTPPLTLPVREDQCLDKSLSSQTLPLPPHPHCIPTRRLTCGDWDHLSTLQSGLWLWLLSFLSILSKGGKSVVMPSFGVIGNDNDTNDNDGLAAPCYW